MPYVITTRTPSGYSYSRTDCRTGYIVRGPGGQFACRTIDSAKDACAPRVSRVAVATLDEAQHEVDVITAGRDASVVPESGCTIGPLPDGTIIEVKAVTTRELSEQTESAPLAPLRDVLAAFNAS